MALDVIEIQAPQSFHNYQLVRYPRDFELIGEGTIADEYRQIVNTDKIKQRTH